MIFLTLVPGILLFILLYRVEMECQEDYLNSLNDDIDLTNYE